MKLVVTLRVKNAILFIEEWIACYAKLVDGILVVDNGSTDGTLELLKKCPKVIEIVQTEGFNEGRDNGILVDLLHKYKPEWVITVDSDEIFEDRLTRDDLDKMMNRSWVSHYRFTLFNLFNDRNHFISEKFMLNAMRRGYGRSLYRYSNKLYVKNDFIHVGINGKSNFYIPSSFRLLHLCFLNKEYRLKVYENYMKVDGENKEHKSWYERDVSMLLHPEKVKIWKFSQSNKYIFRDFIYFNTLYPFKIIKYLLFKNKNDA